MDKSKEMSKTELQNEVRKLRLELQGYRVFGTPMEIAIKINQSPPVCFWCNFQIEDRTKCAIVESPDHERYWLHHECVPSGMELIQYVERDKNHKA